MTKLQKIGAGVLVVIGLVFLSQVFNGRIELPQELGYSFFRLRYYGVFLALGIVAAYLYATKRLVKYKITQAEFEGLALWAIIFGFVGARIYHVISEFDLYLNAPMQIFRIWQGGLSIYGAVLGGLIGIVVYLYRHHQLARLGSFLDLLAPSLIIGQMIGRLGNLFNYELYGYPTNLLWKMFVPVEFRSGSYLSFKYFHPLFLYEIILGLVILFILERLSQKTLRSGQLFLTYLFLYNIGRFFLEFLRIDSVYWGDLRINAFVSLGIAVVCLGVYFYKYGITKTSTSSII